MAKLLFNFSNRGFIDMVASTPIMHLIYFVIIC